jgi:DNA-binding CsgD family transcriptional regulator
VLGNSSILTVRHTSLIGILMDTSRAKRPGRNRRGGSARAGKLGDGLTQPLGQPAGRTGDVVSVAPAQAWSEPALKTIFDDLSDGVLVINAAGHRVYANQSLNDLVGGDACAPYGTAEPPPYVPVDQRRKYLRVLEGMASLLTVDGSGAASTYLDLDTTHGRVRARLTVSAFSSPERGRFVVFVIAPEQPSSAAVALIEPLSTHSSGPAAVSRVPGQTEPLVGLEKLTPRERDVLALLVDGRRVATIARALFVSEYTVRNHLKAIFRKLHVHSQAELLDRFRPVS